MNPLNHISKFLTKNGFKKDGALCYINDNCSIIIYDNYFSINHDGNIIESDTHDIYWLIGALTYWNLIDRNFKI